MRRIVFFACAYLAAATPSFADDVSGPPPAAPSVTSPLQDAVRLTPVPELSLMVPHSWIACDPAANQQLSNATLPAAMQQKLCDPTQPPHTEFKLINPNLTEFAMAIFMEFPAEGRQELERVGSETGDAQQRDMRPLCDGVMAGSPGSTCTANVRTLAGHQAVVGQIERMTQGAKIGMNGKFVVLATSNHVYALLFVSLKTATPNADATIDAIIDSIEAN
jgi:hypothetical protein